MKNNKKTDESMITLPIEKFKHLGITKDSIDKLRELVEHLNKRKKLFAELNKEEVGAYEYNEKRIDNIRTDIELAKIHASIIQKEQYIKDYVNNVNKMLDEMGKRWSEIMEKGNKKAIQDSTIKEYMESAKDMDFENNYEQKIAFYIQLKKLIYPKGEPVLNKLS